MIVFVCTNKEVGQFKRALFRERDMIKTVSDCSNLKMVFAQSEAQGIFCSELPLPSPPPTPASKKTRQYVCPFLKGLKLFLQNLARTENSCLVLFAQRSKTLYRKDT